MRKSSLISRWLTATTRWALSLLAAVFTCVWIATIWWTFSYRFSIDSRLAVSRGEVVWDGHSLNLISFTPTNRNAYLPPTRWPNLNRFFSPASDTASWSWKPEINTSIPSVRIPLWLPFIATGLPAAALWTSTIRRRRRESIGTCIKCGYSMASLPIQTPCPECGHPPSTAHHPVSNAPAN